MALCALTFLAPASARRLPGDQVAAHLVMVAQREWRDWGCTVVDTMDGHGRVERQGARETDTAWLATDARCRTLAPFDARSRVRRYWTEGLNRTAPATPWSAAFISYLTRQVGLSSPAFVVDAAHANYLRALHARAGSDEAQFELLLAEETPLRVGDLLCGPRNLSDQADRLILPRMRTLDDLEALTASHCDLVVELRRRSREARAIGGNVTDSVAMTRLPLTIDGRAIRTLARPWFVIARVR